MNPTQPKHWTPADIVLQAVAMLAIGNVAVHRAQVRNRAQGIPNYYSIGGRIVSDVPFGQFDAPESDNSDL
jgi:hypothetical protein